jgi:hypothetical protein
MTAESIPESVSEIPETIIYIVKPRILGGTSIGITIPSLIIKDLAKQHNVDLTGIKTNIEVINDFLKKIRGIWYKDKDNKYIMKLKVIE